MPIYADAVAITGSTLSGVQTVDGHPGTAGVTRVLAPNQDPPQAVGVYVMQEGPWTRAPDFDEGAEMPFNAEIVVKNGSQAFAGSVWYVANPDPPVVGTDPINIRLRAWGQALGAGAGISQGPASLSQSKTGVTADTYDRVRVGEDGRVYEGFGSTAQTTFIEGLAVRRTGAGSLVVEPGAAWIEGPDELAILRDPVTLTNMALTVGWNYLYLYVEGGEARVEYDDQRPASPYLGSARSKGGGAGGVQNNTDPDEEPNMTRRYIPRSAFYATTTAGGIHNFAPRPGGFVQWRGAVGSAPGRIVANALNNAVQAHPATAGADVPAWPPTATALLLRAAVALNANEVGAFEVAGDGDGVHTVGVVPGIGVLSATASDASRRAIDSGPVSLGAARQVLYGYSARTGQPVNAVDVRGWWED